MKRKLGKKAAIGIWIAVLAICSLVRIWLSANSGLNLLADALYDDAIQIRLGKELAEHRWLGAYSYVTLIKGISFPIFVCVVNYCKIAYSKAMGILIVACSALFILALRKKEKNPWLLGLFYLFLIFHPLGFSTNLSQRVYRNSITGWVLLAVLAGLIGIWYRKKDAIWRMLPWSVLCAVSFPYFWYLREDSIWILPLMAAAAVLVWGYEAWIRKVSAKRLAIYTILLLLPFASLFGTKKGIERMNAVHYGIAEVNDRTGGSFAEVMGLLYRIEDAENNTVRWISQNSIRQAMAASPSLARLEEPLFDDLAEGTYDGDMWQWYIRAAANELGYYENAEKAELYFSQVADELREGFAEGVLTEQAGIALSGQARMFQLYEFPGFVRDTFRNLWNLAGYRYCEVVYPLYAQGDPGNIELLESIIGQTLPRTEADLAAYPDMERAAAVSQCIVSIYQRGAILLILAALIGYIALTVQVIADVKRKQYQKWDDWIVITGIALSLFLLTLIVTMFCSWMRNPVQDDFYLAGGHIMTAVLDLLIWIELKDMIAVHWNKRWEKKQKNQ